MTIQWFNSPFTQKMQSMVQRNTMTSEGKIRVRSGVAILCFVMLYWFEKMFLSFKDSWLRVFLCCVSKAQQLDSRLAFIFSHSTLPMQAPRTAPGFEANTSVAKSGNYVTLCGPKISIFFPWAYIVKEAHFKWGIQCFWETQLSKNDLFVFLFLFGTCRRPENCIFPPQVS